MNRVDGTDRTHAIVMDTKDGLFVFGRPLTQLDARLTSARLNLQSRRTPARRRRFHWTVLR